MDSTNHKLFDARQKKPKIYSVKNVGSDVTIQQIEAYKFGKGEIRFVTPNMTSIFISVGDKALLSAKKIYTTLLVPKETIKGLYDLNEAETVQLYNYFELIQTAIITFYSAIESLTNVLIPEGFILESINNKGIKEVWNKSSIERWKQTREKLKEIIPKALNISSPASYKCWSRFMQFEEIRNDIIHIKDKSLTNLENEKKLMRILISNNIFSKVNAAKELIKELSAALPNHYETPILYNKETLIPIVINSWDELNAVKIE